MERLARLSMACVMGLSALVLGCSSSDESDKSEPRPADDAAQAARAACEFQAGALPRETLGRSDRIGDQLPVDHILVLMMENRSFDHYFSKLPEQGQPDVAVADASYVNTDTNGAAVSWFHTTDYCVEDPHHGWDASHEQWSDGKNDGFVKNNDPDGARAMGYLDQTDIPFYYDLAKDFAISDRYFCSILGPTWPNRMFLYSGSSHGLTKNTLPTNLADDSGEVPNLFAALPKVGVEWKVYRTDLPPAAMFLDTWFESTSGCSTPDAGLPCRLAEIDELFADLASGELPPVVFIDPGFSDGWEQTSEHPPGNPQLGQKLVWQVVDAFMKSPIWSRSVLFITYDEHGGFADHVPPPPACNPNTGEPEEGGGYTFDRYGFRVPLFVVSPYAKKNYVSHVDRDHTSILRFIQSRFGIEAFSARDANADTMLDMFDFSAVPHADPPSYPEPAVDPAKLTECEALF
jgi:phospholipase C